MDSSIIPIDQIDEVTCTPGDAEMLLSTDEAASMAATLKALGHPVRLQILDILSRGRVMCASVI